jgi:hypothetical protein
MPHSRAGIASVILGALCIGVVVLLLFLQPRKGGSRANASPSVLVAQIIALLWLALVVAGAGLGIVGLLGRRRRVTAVVGLCLNGPLLGLAAMLILYYLQH